VKNLSIVFAGLLLLSVIPGSAAEDRKERVLNDRKQVEASGNWIYNDLPKGLAEAARTGKPLLVVIRCIP
jgi:hypothetical protein